MDTGRSNQISEAPRSRSSSDVEDADQALARSEAISIGLRDAISPYVSRVEAGSRARIAEEQEAAESVNPAVIEMVRLLVDHTSDAYDDFAFEHLGESNDPQTVARTLLGPAARAIGAAWCGDTEDFVQTTFVVARLQRLFWKMVADCPVERRPDPQKFALLAPTPGEQHTFGLSIIEDQLRRAGWEVDCCRAGDGAEMLHLASTNKYRFVGISLAGEALLPSFSSAIAKLKAKSLNRSIMVIAGGGLSTRRPDMAVAAGADCVGEDGRSLLRLAEVALAADRPKIRDHLAVD